MGFFSAMRANKALSAFTAEFRSQVAMRDSWRQRQGISAPLLLAETVEMTQKALDLTLLPYFRQRQTPPAEQSRMVGVATGHVARLTGHDRNAITKVMNLNRYERMATEAGDKAEAREISAARGQFIREYQARDLPADPPASD